MPEKSMMIISSEWDGNPTFKMISISKDSPYNECIYDPEKKALAIITKEAKDKPTMMPKLTQHGRAKIIKDKDAEGKPVEVYAQERIIFPAFFEYFIENEDDIREIISMFAINPKHKALGIMTPVGAAKKKEPSKK